MSHADHPPLAAADMPYVELPADLQLLLEELPPGRAARGVRQLAARLQAGDSIESSLVAARDLPAHLKQLIEAAWRSPQAGGLPVQFVASQRKSLQLRREIKLALTYPLLLMLGLWTMFICFEHFFIAPLVDLLEDFDLSGWNAPAMAVWLSSPASVIVSASLLLVVVVAAVLRLFSTAPILDGWLNWLPVLGPIWRWNTTANWCRVLALLVDAGTPLPKALQLASSAVGGEIAQFGRDAANRVAAGDTLSTALARTRSIPCTLSPLVAWGEQNASLAEGLRTAAEMFEGRIRAHLTLLRTWLPPLCFVVAALTVWILVAAALFPLLRVLEAIV